MMTRRISVDEAAASLPELVGSLKGDDEIVLTKQDEPVARIVRSRPERRRPRKPGSAKGILTIVSEDDEHLSDFREYMP